MISFPFHSKYVLTSPPCPNYCPSSLKEKLLKTVWFNFQILRDFFSEDFLLLVLTWSHCSQSIFKTNWICKCLSFFFRGQENFYLGKHSMYSRREYVFCCGEVCSLNASQATLVDGIWIFSFLLIRFVLSVLTDVMLTPSLLFEALSLFA